MRLMMKMMKSQMKSWSQMLFQGQEHDILRWLAEWSKDLLGRLWLEVLLFVRCEMVGGWSGLVDLVLALGCLLMFR
ncbi:hypothetical protein DPMN_054817 [Dreissena polymorpha]|uniref:Uncharacterized protein n=1 Tax=Dreissena polymorpha TaxID=45954 RepID=A0A9D4CRD2_DREPO|nr:hypothetical protein DPMN_054817 [Dreissena polymorpha]